MENLEQAASIDDIIADLRGFGVEELEEPLVLTVGAKTVRIKFSNIPTEDDLQALVAVEGAKGYIFFQEVKLEILSRAISWINGISIRQLSPNQRFVADPTDGGIVKDIQVVLRQTIRSWGTEVLQVLWIEEATKQALEQRVTQILDGDEDGS